MSVIVEIKGKVIFDDLIDKKTDYAGKETAYRMCPPSKKLKVVTFLIPMK